MTYIEINHQNIETEHICCAFSDKKCTDSYAAKKGWLSTQFKKGYVFRRLDERAKVFIEYGPVEKAWVPVKAKNHFMLGCFWVSGQYKGQGHGKALLNSVIDDAKAQGIDGLLAITGGKKFHFMSDAKWLMRQGFEVCDSTDNGFNLLVKKLSSDASDATFNPKAKANPTTQPKGVTVYYSNRCPYSEYHVTTSLAETCKKRGLPMHVHKLETLKQAQQSPTPATIFSLFVDGQFVTTDISACMDSRFDKATKGYF